MLVAFYSLSNKLFKRRWDQLIGKQAFTWTAVTKNLNVTGLVNLADGFVSERRLTLQKFMPYMLKSYI